MFLNSDNVEARQVLESCYKRKKTLLNPIINWEDEDVWEFIREYEIPYCKLYDEGRTRLGCIGCPMAPISHRKTELERYPKYKAAYLRAFARMLENKKKKAGRRIAWDSPEDVMDWWLYGHQKKDVTIEGQITLEDLYD